MSAGVTVGSTALVVLAGDGRDERLLLRQVPAAGLHLLDLLGGGDDGPEPQQVRAQPQHQRVAGGRPAAVRRGVRLLRLAEVELAVLDGDLVADLAGPDRPGTPSR